jgi:hypothetical protein
MDGQTDRQTDRQTQTDRHGVVQDPETLLGRERNDPTAVHYSTSAIRGVHYCCLCTGHDRLSACRGLIAIGGALIVSAFATSSGAGAPKP